MKKFKQKAKSQHHLMLNQTHKRAIMCSKSSDHLIANIYKKTLSISLPSQSHHSNNEINYDCHNRSYDLRKYEEPKRVLSDIADQSIQFNEILKDDFRISNGRKNELENALRPISPIGNSYKEVKSVEIEDQSKKESKTSEELIKINEQEPEQDSRREFSYHSSDDEKSVVHSPSKFISRASKIFIPPFLDEQKSDCDSNIIKSPELAHSESVNDKYFRESNNNCMAMKSTKSHTNSEMTLNNSKRLNTNENDELKQSNRISLKNNYSSKVNPDELRKDIANADMKLSVIQESMVKQDNKIAEQRVQIQNYESEIRKLEEEKKQLESNLINGAQWLQKYRALYDYVLQCRFSVQSSVKKLY